MESLWFTLPSGDRVPNPTVEVVLKYLSEETGESFSPVAVLCWHDHPKVKVLPKMGFGSVTMREQLLFVRHPKRGWYFEYSTSNMPVKRWLVPFDTSADPDSFVTGWAYGEQLHFLRGCFVQQAIAEVVVSHFVSSRKPSRVVRWVPYNRVRPRLDSDQYRERRREARAKSEPKTKKPKRTG